MGYDLYYWPAIQGRGEFVRLALEATRTPYRDVAREEGVPAMIRKMGEGATPAFAPPFLVDGTVMVAQAAGILQYLGPKLGLTPEGEAEAVWCHQIQLTITDFVAEAHDTHHPLGNGLFYEDQKPEALRRAKGFVVERIPKYFRWLERAILRNPTGTVHLVGDALSTADVSVFQLVEGLRYAFPNAMRRFERDFPQTAQVHRMVRDLPAVAAYVASDRRVPFSENGIFRHYPELDAEGDEDE
ncbi:glutathione S-transferase [Acidisphaera sp. L21]|uniref:glutathione S-transferase n=1 Tax=Acidisphaera sp. L21 TaxID=1641851 RepID=UPI00131DF1D1|nr:glutathione S-transferase [Acidisphaera sp. L21]